MDARVVEAELARLLRNLRPHAVGAVEPTLERDTPLIDLVTDSFELVELVIELQERLGVQLRQDDLKGVKTVGDLERVFWQKAVE